MSFLALKRALPILAALALLAGCGSDSSGEDIKRPGREEWYDHKGFFENKLKSPGIYDRGKVKAADERLRMPNIFLPDSDVTALLIDAVALHLFIIQFYAEAWAFRRHGLAAADRQRAR